jgi:membrane-bound lytic murein transglycosylase D
MGIRKSHLVFGLSAALLLAGGCETSNPNTKPVTSPPAAAMAPSIAPPSAVPPAPKIAEKLVPKMDPVDKMIADAEREYQQGNANYTSGHLEAAKADFDRAVSVLMSGPVDIKADERLQSEFDKIVDGVHELEMAALKQGDGFTEQNPQPAPIDEANEVTFPVDPNVKAKAEAELAETKSDLPLVMNDYVASYVNYFSTRGRGYFERALVRSGRYREMIQRVLKEEGLPQDLIYLAQAESGFEPLALSRVGARGMWQFMHYTAPGYGLHRSWWVDDRQDPEKATRAAARYLKDLYGQFGDWYLAMAAYNSGAGNVQRGVQRTGYADFWQLYRRNVLPEETKNYVPIIVAMTIVAKHPDQYGFSNVQLDPPLEADVVKTDYAVDLRLAAEAVGTSVEQLLSMNPSLLRMTTPKDEEFELRVPAGTKDKFETVMAAIPKDKRVLWRYHTVEAGETLDTIARKYHTSASSIAEVNNLEGDEVLADSSLVIPVSGRAAEARAAYSKQTTRVKVRKGDTVLSVADDFGVPAEMVRKWNRLKGNNLRVGRSIIIHKPLAGTEARVAEASAHRTSRHKKGTKLATKAAKKHKSPSSAAVTADAGR